MNSKDALLQPFTLKHLFLRNRILSTSHEPAYSEDGLPKDRYRLYHVEKARGGVALNMTAGSAVVSPDSPASFGNLHAYRDEIVPWLKTMVDECHELGSAMMIQLTHLGRRTKWNKADWLPVLAPSPVREPAHRSFPKQAEDWDIERIIKDYAAAAQRMQAAGMDGIEIESFGHFLDSFWSPATNRRSDDWGGSLDNRLRFTRRVLDAVRDSVGPEFIVGLRMVADESWDKGLSKEEGIEIARRMVATGQVDFLNIIRGHIDTDAALVDVIPVMGMASAPHLDFAGEVRAETKIPIFHAAKISDVATARHAIAQGKVDMIGMTRAHLADPHIGIKIAAGREDDIRPCVGATYCLDRIYEGNEALCIHNPATGREGTMPHVIPVAGEVKKAVVVGAGPGGLEAARVLAERGHDVVMFEAADNPGGQVLLASQSIRRRDLVGIIDWRVGQCEKLGVSIRTNTWAEAPDVLAESPDIVIIATGGLPNTSFLQEGEDLAVTGWDIISGGVKAAANVLLFDDNGSQSALQAAEVIAMAGSTLEILTPERFFAPEVGGMNHVPYVRCFEKHHVSITLNRRLVAIRRNGNALTAVIASDYSDILDERTVDQIVIDHGTLPLDDLYFDLKENAVNRGEVDHKVLIANQPQTLVTNPDGEYRLYRIGDAVSSRNIHAAIYDALRLCKDL